jgi:hypothetical protein
MKKVLLFLMELILINTFQLINAQDPDWSRVLQLNTYGIQFGQVVTSDANYVYLAGSITGPVTFEGTGFLSVGMRDLIIAKISTAGTTSWKKQINAQAGGAINAYAINVDQGGNLFISGLFNGTITVGGNTISSTTLIHGYMAKFDSNGNGLWITAFESIGTGISKIAIDATGSSYLLSRTRKLIKFNNSGIIQWEQVYLNNTLQAVAVYGSNLFIGGALQPGSTIFSPLLLYSNYTLNTGFLARADLDGVYNNALVDRTTPKSTKEGTYFAEGTFVHPIQGARVINLDKYLTGSAENVLNTTIGDLTSTSGYLILTINPDNSVTIGGTLLAETNPPVVPTTGLENRYDPVEKKFYLNYEYTLLNGKRTISEVLTRSYSYSGNGSAFTDIAVTTDGKLIITGSHTSDLTLNPFTVVKPTVSSYTFIAKCDNNFYFNWINSSNALVNPNNELYNYRIFLDNSGKIYEYGLITNSFSYGSVLVNPNGGQFLFRFDSSGNPEEGFALQNTYNGRVYLGNTGKIFTTGSNDYAGATSFGNLYLIQYNNLMSQDWKKISTGAQSGTARISYVKHDTIGNTYVQSRIRGYCNYFGTIIENDNEVTVNSKLDLNGNLLWLNIIPDLLSTSTAGPYFGPKLTLDKDQNLLTVGTFGASLTIGTYALTNLNSLNDFYILKYTTNGQPDWVVQLETDGACEINGITADEENNIIVSGEFKSQMTILGHTISSGNIDAAFLLKLDPDGNYLWAKGFPIGGVVYHAIPATDANNNIYLAADIESPDNKIITFGSVIIPQPETEATVLAKFDPSGNALWGKTYAAVTGDPINSFSWPVDIKTDANGNSYLWGWCSSNASFGTTILVNPLSNSYSYYLAKINTSGDVVWAKAIYEKNFSFNYGDLLDLDESGNAYVGGHFRDVISIEGTTLSPVGTNDFFAAKYLSNGEFEGIKTIPANSSNLINSISVFKENAMTIGGYAGMNSTLGSFEIYKKGGSSCIVATIGNLKFLTATPNSLTIESLANSTASFGVASNISWTAISNQPWLTLSRSSGTGYASITLTAGGNALDNDRIATVTVSGTGVEPQLVNVTQAGLVTNNKEIDISNYIDLYPNPNNGKFNLILNFINNDDVKLTITNSVGVVIRDLNLMKKSGIINQEIDLGNIAKGFYFINLHSGKTRFVKTFVVK